MLFSEPPRSPWDLRFWALGFPVRVHPFFWLVAALLGLGDGRPQPVVIWVGVVFVSVLVHELGHALAARYFRWPASIVLYGGGGLALLEERRPTMQRRVIVALAGPAAGFLLAALIILLVVISGQRIEYRILGWQVTFGSGQPLQLGRIGLQVLDNALFINIYWGLVNLLPIFPLDGGRVARELFINSRMDNGLRASLQLSMTLAVALAVATALAGKSMFMPLFFGLFALDGYQRLSGRSLFDR